MFSNPIQFEFQAISAGDELPSKSSGPITTLHLMRWVAAIENWHRIHYDLPFATEHDGLPGLLINGSWKQHFFVQYVREWAGPDAWVSKVGFKFLAMDVVGDSLTATGKVLDTEERDGFGYVNLEIAITNSRGVQSTAGTATVVFPITQPVPYPFDPAALALKESA